MHLDLVREMNDIERSNLHREINDILEAELFIKYKGRPIKYREETNMYRIDGYVFYYVSIDVGNNRGVRNYTDQILNDEFFNNVMLIKYRMKCRILYDLNSITLSELRGLLEKLYTL